MSVGVLGVLALGAAFAVGLGSDAVLVLALLALVSLAVFSMVGGATMRRQPGRRRAGAVSALLGGAVLGYCVVTAWARWRDADPFPWLVALGAPATYVAALFVAFVGYGALYGRAVRRWAPPVDVVVVLGAGLSGDRVSPLLASRLDRGRQALERSRLRGRDTHVICSGGQGPDEPLPEAVAMARYLGDAGVEPELVWLEDRSTSTEENLRFSAEVAALHGVESGRFAVVTNDFHAFRAAMLMRDAGLAGFGLGSATVPSVWPGAVLREFAAVLWERRLVHGALLLIVTAVAVVLAAT